MTDVQVTLVEKLQLEENFLSALIKLIYAFIWQEWAITDNPIFLDPDVNARGAALIPIVNGFCNQLNTFPIYDQNLQVFNTKGHNALQFPGLKPSPRYQLRLELNQYYVLSVFKSSF